MRILLYQYDLYCRLKGQQRTEFHQFINDLGKLLQYVLVSNGFDEYEFKTFSFWTHGIIHSLIEK